MSAENPMPDVVGGTEGSKLMRESYNNKLPVGGEASSSSSSANGVTTKAGNPDVAFAEGSAEQQPPPVQPKPDFSQFDDSEDEEHYHSGGLHSDNISIERIRQYLSDKLGFYTTDNYDDKDGVPRKRVLETVDIDGVIKHWKNGGFKKIVTMVGAGISTCKYTESICIFVTFVRA